MSFSTVSFTTGTEDTMSIFPSLREVATFSMPGTLESSSVSFLTQFSHFMPPTLSWYS